MFIIVTNLIPLESKETRTNFGIPLAQVIANDAEAEDVASRGDTTSTGRRSLVRQEEVVKDDGDEISITEDTNHWRNSLPNSYGPLLRSNSFNLDEQDELNLVDSESLRESQDQATAVLRRESVRRRQSNNHYRRSRLLDALTLSSSSASYVSILDRDDELKPPGPQVPKIVLTLIEYIEQHALTVLGIFRTGGLRKRVRHVSFLL